MSREKYNTCRHSTGNIGELIVYVHPSCPCHTKIRGSLVSSKTRCRSCEVYERRKPAEINQEFEEVFGGDASGQKTAATVPSTEKRD